jgi:hypothetical protein
MQRMVWNVWWQKELFTRSFRLLSWCQGAIHNRKESTCSHPLQMKRAFARSLRPGRRRWKPACLSASSPITLPRSSCSMSRQLSYGVWGLRGVLAADVSLAWRIRCV